MSMSTTSLATTSFITASCSRYWAHRSLRATFSVLQPTPVDFVEASSMLAMGDGAPGKDI